MKITNKTLLVSFQTEAKLGNNDAIELVLEHQAFISENKDGDIEVDIDLSTDVKNVKFLGIEIEPGFKAYKSFKNQLSELGINLNELINEKENELMGSGLKDKLKLMFKDKF